MATSVQETADGGFVLGGYSPRNVAWLAKSDSSGNLEWEKEFGSEEDNRVKSVRQTSDGGYILLGFSTRNVWGEPLLIKVDEEGHLIWQKFYPGERYWQASCVEEAPEGGFLFGGSGDFEPGMESRAFIAKTDSGGNLLWRKTYGEEVNGGFNAIWRTSDGNYIVAGGKALKPTEGYRAVAWMAKIDEEGDLVWDKSLDEIESSQGNYLEQTDDSGYVAAGSAVTEIEGLSGSNILISKIDPDGELEWQKEYDIDDEGPHENPVSIQQTDDGGYILTCTAGAYERPRSSYFVKFNSKGDISWKKSFDKIYLCTAQQTSDGAYVLVGNTYSKVPTQDIHGGGARLAKFKE